MQWTSKELFEYVLSVHQIFMNSTDQNNQCRFLSIALLQYRVEKKSKHIFKVIRHIWYNMNIDVF